MRVLSCRGLEPEMILSDTWFPLRANHDIVLAAFCAAEREHMEGMSSIGKVVSETRLEDYQRLAQVAKKQVR